MRYLIDANNLAGELNILDLDKFDLFLIKEIKKFIGNRNILVDLVFDPIDSLGDQSCNGNINIVYTPKDSYYNCADDKIVEIFSKIIKDNNEIVLVTSDVNLKARISEILSDFCNKNVEFQKSSDFVLKLEKKCYNKKRSLVQSWEMNEKDRLNKKDKQEITGELINLYGCISKK